jgi:citrate lyase subunit beta / citryl-CoA lyase
MLAKAVGLPADQVFLDLEDAVPPQLKEAARANVVTALTEFDWGDKTVVVRINAVDTIWAADDILTIVAAAGDRLHCIMLPKVEHAHHVHFADHLLRMTEAKARVTVPIGIEAQIESATGLRNVFEIANASPRLETLVFGPADMSASLGLPTVSAGLPMPGYPGDHFHAVLVRILIAARDAGLQVIDGPYLRIEDRDGLRTIAGQARALGYDGKWALHPGQIDVLNDVFTPRQVEIDRAAEVLARYAEATEVEGLGAVMLGNEMIDEASRKMALQLIRRGERAGVVAARG